MKLHLKTKSKTKTIKVLKDEDRSACHHERGVSLKQLHHLQEGISGHLLEVLVNAQPRVNAVL